MKSEFVSLREAARLENSTYENMKKIILRNSNRYFLQRKPREGGGRPLVYIAVSSLSPEAQERYRREQAEKLGDTIKALPFREKKGRSKMKIKVDGERIVKKRLSKGWSANRLAVEAEVMPTTIYDIENGRRSSRADTISKVCKALELNVEDVIRIDPV